MHITQHIIQAQIIDENQRYSLKEICTLCDIHAEFILEMVELGIIEPYGEDSQRWIFDEAALQRSKTAIRLHQDLDMHLSGLALTLDLIEEIDALKIELKSLKQQLKSMTS